MHACNRSIDQKEREPTLSLVVVTTPTEDRRISSIVIPSHPIVFPSSSSSS